MFFGAFEHFCKINQMSFALACVLACVLVFFILVIFCLFLYFSWPWMTLLDIFVLFSNPNSNPIMNPILISDSFLDSFSNPNTILNSISNPILNPISNPSCFPFRQSYFIKLFDAGLQFQFIRTFWLDFFLDYSPLCNA